MHKSCPVPITQRSLAFDYAVAIASLWIANGFFLDAWAHGHVPIESFFTPYHGVFYSGMVFMAAVLAIYWLRFRGLPPGYRLAIVGIPVFLVAGVGDLLWHLVLGLEEGVDALLSPTHQALGLGIFLLASGPIRSVLANRDRSPSLVSTLPLVLSLAAWLTLVHFGTAYAFDPAAGSTNAPPAVISSSPEYFTTLAIGYYKIGSGVLIAIFQCIVMTGFALWMVSRLSLAPGSFTIFFVLGNVAAAAAYTNQSALFATVLAQSLVTGIVADTIVAKRDPSPAYPQWYRIFAVTVPLAYMGTYLVTTFAVDRLWWDWNEALGAWLWCGVVGFGLSLIGTARRAA